MNYENGSALSPSDVALLQGNRSNDGFGFGGDRRLVDYFISNFRYGWLE